MDGGQVTLCVDLCLATELTALHTYAQHQRDSHQFTDSTASAQHRRFSGINMQRRTLHAGLLVH